MFSHFAALGRPARTPVAILSGLAARALLPAALAVALVGAPLIGATLSGTALAQQTQATEEGDEAPAAGTRLPRFVSLRAPEVNLRTGPGTRYPIDWVYQRRDLPVEVIDEFDTWRRIRDSEGTAGWVHQSMLQTKRSVQITAEGVSLRRDPQDDARALAKLERGVIARLESCGGAWCVIEIDGYKGWIKRADVWGVYPDEDVH